MNFHSDKWIMEKVFEHCQEAETLIPKEHIVGIFLQGSQNYGILNDILITNEIVMYQYVYKENLE